MGRYAWNQCGRRLGLLMRNGITTELERRGRARTDVVRLFARVDASGLIPVVQALFANFGNGEMCSEVVMARVGNPPVVHSTKVWAVAVMGSRRRTTTTCGEGR